MAESRVGVVVLTHNRVDELMRTLGHLTRLPEAPPIVVVDNASTDGTAQRVAERYGQVRQVRQGAQEAQVTQLRLLRRPRNEGAAGRNAGVAAIGTPYVAFCDDDTWWAPGALARAGELLDAHPNVAVLSARVLVGPGERLDPTCERMAASPLPSAGLPGPSLVAFMAGAAVVRASAFREAGGYEPRLLIGAEEALLSLDLLARDWQIVYCAEIVTHHHPSPARDPVARSALLARNRLWIAWLRLAAGPAWRETRAVLREAARQRVAGRALGAALSGLPWVLANRRALPPALSALWVQVQRDGPGAERLLPTDVYRPPPRTPKEPTT